jgi:uncharacterized membrane protein (UPF0127 family)
VQRTRILALAALGALAAAGVASAFGRGTATISTPRKTVTVRVELAVSDADRARGLMGRRTLAPSAGMLFLYPREIKTRFWMKDTLIPLSIAFYGADGKIRRILDMAPCTADPCPVYDPGVRFKGALEVNRGAFARWGVRRGDRIALRR